MRRALIRTTVVLAVFFIGYGVGGYIQHQKTGYFYEIRDETAYTSSFGPVKMRYVTETVGMPFLDPGTSTIVLEDPSGLELTIYKARRVFQESYPYIKDVIVNDNEIRWDDGCYAYALNIQRSDRNGRENDE